MRKIMLGVRNGPLALFDMSFQTYQRGSGHKAFRLGDRAAAYLWVLYWRSLNPTARIVIVDDPFRSQRWQTWRFEPEWMFAGIADEVWLTERTDEHIPFPSSY